MGALSTIGEPMAWSAAVRSDGELRARFLESHVDLVRYLALRMASRLPSHVEVDDLVHDGIVGLLDAVDRYDPERGVQFRTFAEPRIRGAILDGLRGRDWMPRSVRQGRRELDSALQRLSTASGPASEDDVAREMGLELADYRTLLLDLNVGSILSIEELPQRHDAASAAGDAPDAPFERAERMRVLVDAITALPIKERRVLELYYGEELNMKEVGAVLGVTESRVCQLHAQAAGRLRVALAARLHAAGAGRS
jgi:RNA polymerase sigma factor for flagellar operon FliA